jgi:large subunit ribosomal protein L35
VAKLKTNRAAAKRFFKQGNSFKYRSSNRNHILTKKSPKRKRQLRGMHIVHPSNIRAIKRMMPYA